MLPLVLLYIFFFIVRVEEGLKLRLRLFLSFVFFFSLKVEDKWMENYMIGLRVMLNYMMISKSF
jgi:hypothetical protein